MTARKSLDPLCGLSIVFTVLLATELRAADESKSEPKQMRAVLVGVGKYEAAGLPAVAFAHEDAKSLQQQLKKAGFDATLVGDESNNSVVSAVSILEQIKLQGEGLAEDGCLVVFLSGHGIQMSADKANKSGPETYFCLGDADFKRRESLLSISDVVRMMEACGAKRKLLLLDIYRLNAAPVALKAKLLIPPKPISLRPSNVVVFSSCQPPQTSLVDSKLKHSLFTHHVIRYLRGDTMKTTDERLSLAGMEKYVREQTAQYAARLKADNPQAKISSQTPVVLSEVSVPQDWDLGEPSSLVNSVGMKFVPIPAGEFTMGAPVYQANGPNNNPLPTDERGRFRGVGYYAAEGAFINGRPQLDYRPEGDREYLHKVKITRPFYMGQFEVTQKEYALVMGDNPSKFQISSRDSQVKARLKGVQDTEQFPVESVNWAKAVAFAKALSQREGRIYRLPTEAEWEYACRAGTKTIYHFGDSLNGTEANCNGSFPFANTNLDPTVPWPAKGPNLKRPTQVGSYPCNAFGLYDMHGNVMEWCADFWDSFYYARSPLEDPPGPKKEDPNGQFAHVFRGGPWAFGAGTCRAAWRGDYRIPDEELDTIGFRLVLEIAMEASLPK